MGSEVLNVGDRFKASAPLTFSKHMQAMSCMVIWVLKFWMLLFISLKRIFFNSEVKCFHSYKITPGFQFVVQKLKSCISQEFSKSPANFYLSTFFFPTDLCLLKARAGFFYITLIGSTLLNEC